MDILPSGNIFRELQDIHDTGYFSSQTSIEDQWHQVNNFAVSTKKTNTINIFLSFDHRCCVLNSIFNNDAIVHCNLGKKK
jgi:krueppel-like factor 6/7